MFTRRYKGEYKVMDRLFLREYEGEIEHCQTLEIPVYQPDDASAQQPFARPSYFRLCGEIINMNHIFFVLH